MKKYTRAYIIINGSEEILVRRRAPKGMFTINVRSAPMINGLQKKIISKR